MGNRSLSLKFTIFLSLSFSLSASSISFKPFSLSSTAPITPKATPSDLLSLLGPKYRSSTVNPLVARELNSCFKFLVPFTPSLTKSVPQRPPNGRSLSSDRNGDRSRREEDELIWWPPLPVLELARLAVDSGGDPAAIHRALDPTIIPVPDVEGSKENRCQLTRTPYGWRFISEELNSYLQFLFELIASRGPSVGLNVSLNRYDFFHGHLFIASDTRRLGVLFHAKEYPAFDKEVFPYNMGYCQKGSNVTYVDSMNFRNILWLAPLPSKSTKAWEAPVPFPTYPIFIKTRFYESVKALLYKGVLVVLDAHPGGIIYKDIIPDYVDFVRTIYEDDFGEVVVDVNYLNVGDLVPNFQIFIC